MAPYLIFGFAIAGMLHILISNEQVQRLLGRPGLGAVLKACIIGVPIPLCSCSVIPVAASLRKSGASRGATAAFLCSTPQSGVDSMLATYALMGGLFTSVRVAVAFISGIVSGFLIELFCNNHTANNLASHDSQTTDSAKSTELITLSPLQSSQTQRFSLAPRRPKLDCSSNNRTTSSCCASNPPKKRGLSEALRYGFINLPASLAAALLVGLVLAGLTATLLPPDLIRGSFSTGPLAFLLATAISLPLYICATASIPMAYALIAAGLSPGAALIFLITGPATNTATVITIWKMLGRKATVIYLSSLTVIAWAAGGILNNTFGAKNFDHCTHQHQDFTPNQWEHASGIALILILLLSLYGKYKAKQASKAYCCSD
jgi:uncharacterized membrane protein YraQ (UPF0718 family)